MAGLPRGRFRVWRPGQENVDAPVDRPGVYRCYGNDGEYFGVAYVSIRGRLADHCRSAPWWDHVTEVRWQTGHGNLSSESLASIEAEHIERHNPRWNKRAGRGGRRPE